MKIGDIVKQKTKKNKLSFQLGIRYIITDITEKSIKIKSIGEEYSFEYSLTIKRFNDLLELA